MTAPIERVLAAFPNVKQTKPDTWIARCPAHDDRKASLSIGIGDNGVVMHCHANCETATICAAAGLTLADLFPPKPADYSPSSLRGVERRIVATYPYTDEEGVLLYEVVRYEPKDFRQRRPDPAAGKDAVAWNLKGVRRVLYRLADVLAAVAAKKIITVVEGEKDVDALHRIGLTATTNCGGADKWDVSYTTALSGAHVVIMPDNDDPGRKHAARVATDLYGKARSVRVLELPNLPPKGDVSDWLREGGTAAQLRALAKATPIWEPRRAADDPAPAPPVDEATGTTPPYDLLAEKGVLGAMLVPGLDSVYVDEAAEIVTAADFYLPAHAEIFRAAVALRALNTPIDFVTIRNELRRLRAERFLVALGGEAYVKTLCDWGLPEAGVAAYARIVRSKAIYRRLAIVGMELGRLAYSEPGATADEYANSVQAKIADCATTVRAGTWFSARSLLSPLFDEMDERKARGGKLSGIGTGLTRYDSLTAGLVPGTLTILAARPGMGKTALMLSVAANIAKRQEVAAIFSVEMTKDELMQRLLAREAKVWLSNVTRGSCDDDEWQRLLEATKLIHDMPLFIDDEANTVSQMETRLRRLLREQGQVDVVMIDYLQHIRGTPGKKYSNPHEKYTEIVHDLKDMAKSLPVPVVCLSQLSRAVENRAGQQRPVLSDIRESGSIEEKADVVAFIYRNSYYADKKTTSPLNMGEYDEVEIIVAKNRQGATDFVKVGFSPHFQNFADLHEGTY